MGLSWLKSIIDRDFYTPFKVDFDADYYDDLRDRYSRLLKKSREVGADDESIKIVEEYSKSVLEALECYYRADVSECNAIIYRLIEKIGDDPFAKTELICTSAFPGEAVNEIQLYRARIGDSGKRFTKEEMLPFSKRKRAFGANCRFSIPGNPCYYLANSSYGCWIESGFPDESRFNVSPVRVDGNLKVLNLAVAIRIHLYLNEYEMDRVHLWLKLFILTLATSYVISEEKRVFKSEYVISQAIMQACRKLNYDGVVYYSKRVSDEMFAFSAVNLALFIRYSDDEESELIKYIQIDKPSNYGDYKNLLCSARYKDYSLRLDRIGIANNIGCYQDQKTYVDTEYSMFDRYLFAIWDDKLTDR